MKILFPIGSFYPAQVGGPSNTIFWLSEELSKDKKYDVSVITTDQGLENFPKIELNKQINYGELNVLYTKNKNYNFPINMLLIIAKSVKKNDVLILNSIFYIPSLYTAILGVIYNKKIIWSVRGELEEAALKYKSFIKWLWLLVFKILPKKNIIFHATSQSEVYNIKKLTSSKEVFFAPNYLKIPKRLNLKKEELFLFVGRLHSIKALDKIIKGFKESKLFKTSNYHFLIAGEEFEKDYKIKIQELIESLELSSKVTFLGLITGKEKNKIYSKAKFSLLLSNSENFGNVVIESLSQGTPVLASIYTPWQVLEKYNAGFQIDNNKFEIAKYIDKLILLNEKEYKVMSENSIQLVNNKFNITTKIASWKEIINQLK